MIDNTKKYKQELAKGLLVHCLQLPNGVASRRAESLSDAQLDAVCAVANEPKRHRRQVLKAVMTKIAEEGDTRPVPVEYTEAPPDIPTEAPEHDGDQ